jgi:hypothetical protein
LTEQDAAYRIADYDAATGRFVIKVDGAHPSVSKAPFSKSPGQKAALRTRLNNGRSVVVTADEQAMIENLRSGVSPFGGDTKVSRRQSESAGKTLSAGVPGPVSKQRTIVAGQPLYPAEARAGALLVAKDDAAELVLQLAGEQHANQASAVQGGLASAGGEAVIRYACCAGIKLRSDATHDAPSVRLLAPGELVWIVDIWPKTQLATLKATLTSCLANQSCGDIVSEIAKLSSVTYFAEIVTPKTGEVGYVPLAALLKRAPTVSESSFSLELGFDQVSNAFATALEPIVSPELCEGTKPALQLAGNGSDKIYDRNAGGSVSCLSAIACDGKPTWRLESCVNDGDTNDDNAVSGCACLSQASDCDLPADTQSCAQNDMKRCVRNPCPYKGTCESCRAWYDLTGQNLSGNVSTQSLVDSCVQDLMNQDGNDGDLPAVCYGEQANCVAYCEERLQLWRSSECHYYVGPADTKVFENPRDYRCGEYPIGTTHPDYRWTKNVSANKKRIASFELFDESHDIEMTRLEGQRASDYDVFDLSTQAVRNVHAPKAVSRENFWVGLLPYQGKLYGHVCAKIPGTTILGPKVDYEFFNTPYWLIDKIDWGSASVDRVDLCLLARLSVDNGLAPTVDFLDVTQFELVGFNVDDINVDVSGFYAGFVAAAGLVGSVVPIIGPILGPLLSGALIAALGVFEAIESVLDDTDNDEWLFNFLPNAFKAELEQQALTELNDLSRDALMNVQPNVKTRVQQLCGALDPMVTSRHAYYWFYKFAKAQCALGTDYTLTPFVAEPSSLEQGCFGLTHYWTPADAGTDKWWQAYAGQEWYFPFFHNAGCRLSAKVETQMDAAIWPVARCAAAATNSVINGVSQKSLFGTMNEACSDLGYSALLALYGDGSDLLRFFPEANPPLAGQ